MPCWSGPNRQLIRLKVLYQELRRLNIEAWRRLATLLGRLTQIFVETVQAFYARRAAHEGAMGAKTGAVTAVQRATVPVAASGGINSEPRT